MNIGSTTIGRAGSALVRKASDFVDLERTSLIDALQNAAPLARGKLLDVGCGDKPYEAMFTPYVSSYLGIDRQATYVETAASRSDVKADLLYDGSRLPFEDNEFDTVLSLQVLEHTPHPRRLIADMARVLRPGGLLILTAPFSFRLHEEPHDYFRYSSHGLRSLCEGENLTIDSISQRGSLWSVLGHKFNSYLALQVARMGGVGQSVGKLGHEQQDQRRPRLWTLPVVAPTLVTVAVLARFLDRTFFDPTESLGYLLLARK